MKKLRGRWHPSPEQISLALDCAAARMPIDRAAGLLGIGPRTLWIFAKRVGLPVFAVWKGIPARVAGSRTAKMPAPVVFPFLSPKGRRFLMVAARRPGSDQRRGERHRRPAGAGASLFVWAKRARWRKWRARIYLDGRNHHRCIHVGPPRTGCRWYIASPIRQFWVKVND